MESPIPPFTDRGAALITVTITMVVLMAFAAMAVDAAAAWSQRRENQGAVDTAAIAGAQFTVGVAESQAKSNAQQEIIRITYASIQPDMTEAQWEAAWLSCTDTNKPFEFSKTHTSDCVSFTTDLGKIRVKLPNVEVTSAFAWAVGASTIATSAEAEVEISAGSSSTVIPAMYAGGAECRAFGKEQIMLNGSNNTIYGGIHSNDNVDVSGSDNDFGDGNPDEDPFTYVSDFDEGGSNNDFDTGYPLAVPIRTYPIMFDLMDYDTGGSSALAAANYYRRTGDIDGDYIESRGDGLYYATGDIVLDKDLDASVTLVAEGEIEVSGSDQQLEPYIDGLLAFAGRENVGSERCDLYTVSMSGSSNDWSGIIYAPGGLIEMAGSSNSSVTGSLIGNAIMLNGSDLHIEIDPDLNPSSSDPVFSIAE